MIWKPIKRKKGRTRKLYYHKPTKTAYYANPKTASTATANALTKQADFKQIGPHHHGPDAVKDDVPTIARSFCTVRNHYDMIISWHYYIQNNELNHPPIDLTRTKLLTEQHMDAYVTEHKMWPLAHESNIILQYSRNNLHIDLNIVLDLLDIPMVGLDTMKKERNRPRSRPHKQYFTNDAQDYIEQRFGYEINHLNLRQTDSDDVLSWISF